MFEQTEQNDKCLFLLTDGEATDGNPLDYLGRLSDQKIFVFVCLLTSNDIEHPRRLYFRPEENWSKAQKNMFELCSSIENTHSAMSVLLEHGWKLPIEGRSRLFVQANHPDVIEDFR